MSSGQITYRVLEAFSEVSPFLSKVVSAADSDKDALGFFAASVFTDFARRNLLFVAVASDRGQEYYAGHLLFDVRFPKAHVRQIFVEEQFRRRKLGVMLLEALKRHLTALQFISIHARVAEDLVDANQFWEHQDFYPQRVEPGGASKKRVIVVRAHELATPQLFAASGICAADPLGLDIKQDEAKPLFLLDLNVLFDLGPRRPRHEQAIAVFRAERMQACSLAISSEIAEELARTGIKGAFDPMHALASTLPKFSIPPENEWLVVGPDLAALIFPQRARESRLTPNDFSDLRHLATAIYHRLPGLITSDSSVLACAAELRRSYGIEVISPEAFQINRADEVSHAAHGAILGQVLSFEPVTSSDESSIQGLLRGLGVDVATQAASWAAVDGKGSICARYVVKHDGRVVGYLVWHRALSGGQLSACVAVAEGDFAAPDAARMMLNHLSEQVSHSEIARIRISFPSRQVVLREVAAELGYTRSSARSNELQKVMIKRIVSSENWSDTKDCVLSSCEVALPPVPPQFRHIDQQIAVGRPDGERSLVSLFTLETLLAPVLFWLPGRGAVLVPVQPKFAEQLLQHSP